MFNHLLFVIFLPHQTKLCIFKTSNGCGWGVKTLADIKKGSFAVEYVGEVITNDEAEERGKKYGKNKNHANHHTIKQIRKKKLCNTNHARARGFQKTQLTHMKGNFVEKAYSTKRLT